MKIYTKTGDTGETSLLGGKRVSKDDLRIEAYGTIDELNSFLGLLSDQTECQPHRPFIRDIQNQLFIIGSLLAADQDKPGLKLPEFNNTMTVALEKDIDEMEKELPPLTNFILPGGHSANSIAHITRCVCRRSERRVVEMNKEITISPEIIIFLNRLSDWLFIYSRYLLHITGNKEIPWIPQRS